MKIGRKVLLTVIAAGAGAVIISVAGKRIRTAVENNVLDQSQKPGSAADFAVTLRKAMEWSSSTGGTDEELLFSTLALISSPTQWNQTKSKFQQLTGKSLIAELDADLDAWESEVARSIYQVNVPESSETEGKRMMRKLIAWSDRLAWWLARGKPWYGSEVSMYYAGKALECFEEVSHARFLPILSQLHHHKYGETLINLLLLRLPEEAWGQLRRIINNKPDAKGKSLKELFGA